MLGEISRAESLLADLDAIRRDEGEYVAVDLELKWRAEIRAIMRQIERDSK